MRLLVFPHYSNPANLNGCSAYHSAKSLIGWLVKNFKDVYVYWVFPELGGYWHWKEDESVEFPRVKKIFVPLYHAGQRDSLQLATKEFWDLLNERTGKYLFDLIYTDRLSLVPSISMLVGHFSKDRSVKIPIVVKDHFILCQETARNTPEGIEAIQALGMYLADTCVFQSVLTAERAVRMAGKYLRGSFVQNIANKSAVITYGIDCDKLDRIMAKEKYPIKTLLFSQRLEQNANWEWVFKVFDEVYKSGRDVQIIVCTNNRNIKQLERVKKRYPNFIVFGGMPQEKYIEIMSRCHCFLSASRWEEYPTTLYECMYCKVAGVFPDKDWMRKLLPNWYVYYYKSEIGAAGLIRHILDDYTSLTGVQSSLWVKETQDVRIYFNQIEEIFRKQLLKTKDVRVSKELVGLVKEAAQSIGDVFPESMVYEGMKRHSEKGHKVGKDTGAFGISKMAVRHILLNLLGYRDRCDKEFAVYERS